MHMSKISTLFVFLQLPALSFGLARLGIQGGLNLSGASTGSSINVTGRSGLALGALLELGPDQGLGLQIEGMYVQKGGQIPSGSTAFSLSPTSTTKIALDYLEFPVLMKYKIDTPLLKPHFILGPYLAFKMKNEATVGLTPSTIPSKSSELGMTAGAGIELAFTPLTSFFASLRYHLGFSDVDDNTTTSWKNKGVVILGGMMFGI